MLDSERTELPARLRSIVFATILLGLVAWRREWLEGDMARHMLLEFPILLAAGATLGRIAVDSAPDLFSRGNLYGLTGLAVVSLTLAYWMIPAALDASLRDGWVAGAKYGTLLVSGCLLPASFRLAPLTVQAFFVGNVAWMTATVGMLYQDTDRQLCLFYRPDMQAATGRGLVGAAATIAVLWSVAAWHRRSIAGRRAPDATPSVSRHRSPAARSP
jgi:hypothetical protein